MPSPFRLRIIQPIFVTIPERKDAVVAAMHSGIIRIIISIHKLVTQHTEGELVGFLITHAATIKQCDPGSELEKLIVVIFRHRLTEFAENKRVGQHHVIKEHAHGGRA
jgi:hypothetical protein